MALACHLAWTLILPLRLGETNWLLGCHGHSHEVRRVVPQMAELKRRGPYYRVEWVDNQGVSKARSFNSKAAAERYALRIELALFHDVVMALAETALGALGLNRRTGKAPGFLDFLEDFLYTGSIVGLEWVGALSSTRVAKSSARWLARQSATPMITSISPLRTISDHIKLAESFGIRTTFPSSAKEDFRQQVQPGGTIPILIANGCHILAMARWGFSDLNSQQRVDLANANGQNFGYRGLILASSVQMTTSDGRELEVTGRGGPLKIGVTFSPERPSRPLCFKVLFCNASPDLQPYTVYQPVFLRDRFCADFLDPQKSMIAHQAGEQSPRLSVRGLRETADRGDTTSALASFEQDPNYSDRPAFQPPRGMFLPK